VQPLLCLDPAQSAVMQTTRSNISLIDRNEEEAYFPNWKIGR
jgi:hypothetical protein